MSASSTANSPVVRPPTLIVTRASLWLARVNSATYPSGEYEVESSAIDAEPENLTFGPRLKVPGAIPGSGPGTIATLVFG
jgi:hypothetical protein